MEGKLEIVAPGYPRSGAALEMSNGCITLLLPVEYFDRNANWNGRAVRITGTAHEEPNNPDLLWYEYMGRSTDIGVCGSGLFIFVVTVLPVQSQ